MATKKIPVKRINPSTPQSRKSTVTQTKKVLSSTMPKGRPFGSIPRCKNR